MKIFFSSIVFVGLLLTGSIRVDAALFSDTVNFSGTGIYLGNDYLELSGVGSNYSLDYSHLVTFSPPAATITTAEIALTHHNNSDNPGELWFIIGDTSVSIGKLDRSTGNGWVTQTFAIPATLYPSPQSGQWSLQLTLNETTTGTDKLWVDKSILRGTYAPVPIPPASFLLGSSLVGLCFVRRTWLLS